jgi:anti-anti-sigma regulatory factor
VTADHPITCGVFKGFSWIRCEGKGSFMNSPLMKSFGDARVEEGESLLVVDLADCSGMDSTFMGTLAGMATRLAKVDGGMLQVAEADERNRRSLEDLGLDFLMEINPDQALWSERLEEIRSCLEPALPRDGIDQLQRARHVLEAHEELSEINDKNAREFDNVVGTLRKQISDEPESDS